MAFVNEYIPESDYEKCDLRKICGDHNLRSRKGHMHSRSWTIDRESDAFLIKVWSHHESEFSGWAFCWKGEWFLFEMRLTGLEGDPRNGPCSVAYLIKHFSYPECSDPVRQLVTSGLVLPEYSDSDRQQVIADLIRGLGVYCGAGVLSTAYDCTATVEFIGE